MYVHPLSPLVMPALKALLHDDAFRINDPIPQLVNSIRAEVDPAGKHSRADLEGAVEEVGNEFRRRWNPQTGLTKSPAAQKLHSRMIRKAAWAARVKGLPGGWKAFDLTSNELFNQSLDNSGCSMVDELYFRGGTREQFLNWHKKYSVKVDADIILLGKSQEREPDAVVTQTLNLLFGSTEISLVQRLVQDDPLLITDHARLIWRTGHTPARLKGELDKVLGFFRSSRRIQIPIILRTWWMYLYMHGPDASHAVFRRWVRTHLGFRQAVGYESLKAMCEVFSGGGSFELALRAVAAVRHQDVAELRAP